MYVFRRTEQFDRWLRELRNPVAKARILVRIRSAEAGSFGDVASVGNGVREMRVHIGPGYRVYFSRLGHATYLLLCGGDKDAQHKDILRAKEILRTIEANE